MHGMNYMRVTCNILSYPGGGYDDSLLVAACSLVYRYQSFGGTQCHWLQENRGTEAFFLKTDMEGLSKMVACIYQTTQCTLHDTIIIFVQY